MIPPYHSLFLLFISVFSHLKNNSAHGWKQSSLPNTDFFIWLPWVSAVALTTFAVGFLADAERELKDRAFLPFRFPSFHSRHLLLWLLFSTNCPGEWGCQLHFSTFPITRTVTWSWPTHTFASPEHLTPASELVFLGLHMCYAPLGSRPGIIRI